MKNYYLFLLLGLLSCREEPAPTESTPAVPVQAELWQAGIISTEAPEFATSITADERTVYFNRTTPDRSQMQIMQSTFADGKWSQPVALSFSTGEYLDVDPFITADGKRLFFNSDRPVPGDHPDPFNTWYVDWVDGAWSAPVNPGPPLNSDSTEVFVSVAANGAIYFRSERDGKREIFRSRQVDGRYQPVERIPLLLDGRVVDLSNPCVASDESFIIIATRGFDESTAPDLYISWQEDGQWSELQNLGPAVNSAYADFAPGLSKDNRTLYFSSERPGIVPEQPEGVRPPGDIYRVDLQAVLEELKVEEQEE